MNRARGLLVPIAALFAWWAVLFVLRRHRMIGDETVHTVVVEQMVHGDWSRPSNLPMLPIYHGAVALFARVVGTSLARERFASALIGAGLIATGWLSARGRAPAQVGAATARLAFLPFLFPFLALVYSDGFALLFLALAVLAFDRRQFVASGLAFAAACAVRQANVVWALFFALWALADARAEAPSARWPAHLESVLRRAGVHAIVLGTAVVLALMGSSLFIAPTAGNEPRFNLAQYWMLAWCAAVVFAPLLVARARDDVRAAIAFLRQRPELGFGAMALVVLAIGLASFQYENTHLWNRGRGALQNYPLVAMTRHALLRPPAIASALWIYYALGRMLHAQPKRIGLAAFAVGLVAVAPMGLVEPRYYLPAFVVLALVLEHDAVTQRRLAVWSAAVSAASCAPLLRGLIW
jgi:hypothetical protein